MSKYLSEKFTIMYTVLIVMVVYIHSYYLEAQQYNVALFLQNFTGTKGVGRTANYLFFCIFVIVRSILFDYQCII